MAELWLILDKADEDEPERVLVDREKFVIGRHSGADLSLNNSTISRQHARIERFGDIFVIADSDSTYGTNLNGVELTEPAALKDGDTLEFGGVFKMTVELITEKTETEEDGEENPAAAEADGGAVAASAGGGGSFPGSLFLLVPVFGLVILLCVGGGLFYSFSGNSGGDRTGPGTTSTPDEIDDDPDPEPEKTPKAVPSPGSTQPTGSPGSTTPAGTPGGSGIEPPPPPKSSSDMDKVRAYSASFLSRITAQDKSAFLLDRQIQVLMPTVEKFKSSSALADNLKSAKQNSARITAIAAEHGLQPQFLAAAALARIGNTRGDPAAVAQTMAGPLQGLQNNFGNELADEVTVVVAAYEQGAAGKFTQLRGQAEALSGKTQGVSARQVRTIWFLHEQGKLNDSEFEMALRFLVVGTIMQNPADFNVKAEAVILN